MGTKGNEHKKEFNIDSFARRYYCKHARLNKLREDKKRSKRKFRRISKKEEKQELE